MPLRHRVAGDLWKICTEEENCLPTGRAVHAASPASLVSDDEDQAHVELSVGHISLWGGRTGSINRDSRCG